MRVLVACESSGVVRRAFHALGHDAISCDLEPAEDDSPYHYRGDVRDLLGMPFDLVIAHPPCTYLTGSAEWCYKDVSEQRKHMNPGILYGEERRAARVEAIAFARMFWELDVPHVCMENPVGVLSRHIGKAAQIVQPYEFGDDASKKTCLWLRGLPVLVAEPALRVPGRVVVDKVTGARRERWANQTDSGQNRETPCDLRWKYRSRTYDGIATAMAEQWSNFWGNNK